MSIDTETVCGVGIQVELVNEITDNEAFEQFFDELLDNTDFLYKEGGDRWVNSYGEYRIYICIKNPAENDWALFQDKKKEVEEFVKQNSDKIKAVSGVKVIEDTYYW